MNLLVMLEQLQTLEFPNDFRKLAFEQESLKFQLLQQAVVHRITLMKLNQQPQQV